MVKDDIYEDNDLENETFGEGELDSSADGGIVLKDLNWRVENLRLEEQHKKRFLKSRPRSLPYGMKSVVDECKLLVGGKLEDWKEWIAMEEKCNS